MINNGEDRNNFSFSFEMKNSAKKRNQCTNNVYDDDIEV